MLLLFPYYKWETWKLSWNRTAHLYPILLYDCLVNYLQNIWNSCLLWTYVVVGVSISQALDDFTGNLCLDVCLVKRENCRHKILSCELKSMLPHLDLTCSFTCSFNFSQKLNLNQPIWTFLVNTKEVICPVGPLHPP